MEMMRWSFGKSYCQPKVAEYGRYIALLSQHFLNSRNARRLSRSQTSVSLNKSESLRRRADAHGESWSRSESGCGRKRRKWRRLTTKIAPPPLHDSSLKKRRVRRSIVNSVSGSL